VQYLSSAIDSTDNFALFKISSEEESEESITKKRKLRKEVTFYVSKVIKTLSLNVLFSSAIDSLSIDDDLKMREVIQYDKEHINLPSAVNFIDITQS